MSCIAFTGQKLGPTSSAIAGLGTHIERDSIYASRTGHFRIIPAENTTTKPSSSTPSSSKQTFTVIPPSSLGRTSSPSTIPRSRPLIPTLNSLILGKVLRINTRQASVSITAIEAEDPVSGEKSFIPCMSPFPALLRVQDIRATEKDKVKMLESFRVGDFVKGIVISSGDQASYYLSTARNDLGVVMAWTTDETTESALGEQLLPISWNEMMAADSGKREFRKVAKPL